MATLAIEIPNGVIDRVQQICDHHGWTPENPMTKAQFFKAWVISQIKNEIKHIESIQAAEDARAAVRLSVDTDVVIT